MPRFILLLFLCLAISISNATSLVKGRIYLKDGSVIECDKNDRLKIPKRSRKVKLFRRAFYKDKHKETYTFESIDSIICWHASAPQYLRKFIPSPKAGWLWVYIDTPHICVGVYSKKGYGIASNGGIEVFVRQRYFSSSRTAYYLRKANDIDFCDVGSTKRKARKKFRKRIAEYISDDPILAEYILRSRTSRNKTILMLEEYNPNR